MGRLPSIEEIGNVMRDWELGYLPDFMYGDVETILQRSGDIWPLSSIEKARTVSGISAIVRATIFRQCCRFGVSERIYFCFSDSRSVSAKAMLLPSGEFVVLLTEGLLRTLGGVSRALVHCEPFSELFGIQGEFWQINEMNCRNIPRRESGYPVIAKDEFAEELSDGLTVGALSAVIFHEMTHILNGHLGLLANSRPDIPMDVLKSVLEFDADQNAIAEIVRMFCGGAVVSNICGQFMETDIIRGRFSLICSYVMFRVMAGDGGVQFHQRETGIHIRPMNRWLVSAYSCHEIISELSSKNRDEIGRDILRPTVLAIEKSIFLLSLEKISRSALDVANRENSKYFRDMTKWWPIVRSALEGCKIGDHQLAPVQESY